MKTRIVLIAAAGAALLGVFSLAGADVESSRRNDGPPVSAAPAETVLRADPVFDDLASFLAGFPCVSSPYKEFQETAEYREFADALEKNWAELEMKRLGPVRHWARSEIREAAAATTTLFYPFGGPDALTAVILFPQAARHLLLGLEFVGRLPVFTADQGGAAARYIQDLRASLDDFFKKSYFITRNMNDELAGDKVDGVLPLLCFFLKRSGNVIASITRLDITDQGGILEGPFPGEPKKRRRPFGVRLAYFAEGADVLKELSYISCDLSNGAFRENSPLAFYLGTVAFETTFLKSASYLMHYRDFSRIRVLILERSRFVLQDDTGIPFRYFKPGRWTARLYGEYSDPVKDFANVGQPDLKKAFADPARVKSLPFRLGYHWGSDKGLLLYFMRKG